MDNARVIEVIPYNSDWLAMFRQEAEEIAAILGKELLAIHHIGSTAIPGTSAKPIIDIMPLVRCIETVDAFNPQMVQLGYKPKGENTIPGRRFFTKGGDIHRSHHVHVYEPDNPEVARHLDFRDYLIAHPEIAQQYSRLKEDLARRFPYDIDKYTGGKASFVQEITCKAQQWRAEHRDSEQEEAERVPGHTWLVEHNPGQDSIDALRSQLTDDNIERARIDEGWELAVFIHGADRELLGGISGWIWGQCLEIDYLWVHAGLRGRGYGRKLVHTLEREARAQGCQSALVDTYTFQAPGFYRKLGYQVLGTVSGYPRAIQKVFLSKKLV
jgi:GrpB-like predicted nucleotidyltransferase (UPF0157 family)/ribosomal protein S18 acetylase RimI-like enzyme